MSEKVLCSGPSSQAIWTNSRKIHIPAKWGTWNVILFSISAYFLILLIHNMYSCWPTEKRFGAKLQVEMRPPWGNPHCYHKTKHRYLGSPYIIEHEPCCWKQNSKMWDCHGWAPSNRGSGWELRGTSKHYTRAETPAGGIVMRKCPGSSEFTMIPWGVYIGTRAAQDTPPMETAVTAR